MSQNMQTVLKKNVSEEKRHEAIDELIRSRDTTNLAVLVRMNLRGEFCRHALRGLVDCNATDKLDDISTDSSVEPLLRKRAKQSV